MACPDDHPDDKIGQEYCRSRWSRWHYKNMYVEERCMYASPIPKALVLIRKPKRSSFALLTRLFFRRQRARLRIYSRVYMTALKHVIQSAICQYLINEFTADHDDRDSGHFFE